MAKKDYRKTGKKKLPSTKELEGRRVVQEDGSVILYLPTPEWDGYSDFRNKEK